MERAAQMAAGPQLAEAVANWLLDRADADEQPLDPMKLQKLIYFAHGWHLALSNEPLVDELFEAWQYGPVLPSVYHAFKDHGAQPIRTRASRTDWQTFETTTPCVSGTDRVAELLETIWREYGRLSGLQLSHLTHLADSPWDQTRQANPGIRNANIPNALIQGDFTARRERPVDHAA